MQEITIPTPEQVAAELQALAVFVTGGTVNTTVSFSGSINADIGSVKIEDAADNYAVCPPAAAVKTNNTTALVVQAIDSQGQVIQQATQLAIMNSLGTLTPDARVVPQLALIANNQGTLATEATSAKISSDLTIVQNNQGTQATETTLRNVRDGVAVIFNNEGTLASQATLAQVSSTLTAILNTQGTMVPAGAEATEATLSRVMNNQGTQATQATLGQASSTLTAIMNNQGTFAANAVLTKVMNDQGTLATSANQLANNATLTAILNNEGTLATAAGVAAVVNNQGTLATAAGVAVAANNFGTLATASQQNVTNALLGQLILATGTASGTILTATLFGSQTGASTSAALDVTGRIHHSVQHVINGACTVATQTSLDGINWFTESTDTASNILALEGVAKYIRAVTQGSGNVTTMVMSSAPGANPGFGGGGGGVSEMQFSGSISPSLNTSFNLNLNNANGIGFYLVVPPGATLAFEGSWDNSSWESVTLRQMGAHGYSATSNNTEGWIGSCATFNYFRVRTSVAGSGSGSIVGKLSYDQNTLEGIEHGNSPHKIGVTPFTVATTIGTICTDQVLYTPSDPTHKLCVTDILLNGGGLTTVSLCDGNFAEGKHIIMATLRPSGGNSGQIICNFSMPHVFSAPNRPLKFSNSANQDVDIMVHLYETES